MAEAARSPDLLRLEAAIAAPRATVWQALTEQGRLRRWWLGANLEPRPGGEFLALRLEEGNEVLIQGLVGRVDPPEYIEWTWSQDDWPVLTQVVIRLTEAGGGGASHVELSHIGWRRFSAAQGEPLRAAYEAAWGRRLEALKAFSEGRIAD
ncbi:MAG TPA: SRPBCC domain-containing protein [Alphaproteobacteria bacterium]|jgi:uncharacterized protein YndB with AHSA1/START domain|nr:SRPBCC domain-containing protein [Alphaproteobacteria bacterium]MDP6269404.1 SRPBCC domain-containing protein [Alphaproteobacteria bacterium]MDP7164244.1 SRPBCC domain-containing protein [Alphaproteobacteria bacterium]MDP7426801.1 SRPBCC domain-containing protein [Alphaproteobacteria bacterium]HJM49005.1 SRPBCC domain-containing protein [Alphaproteobacteria bacterium]